MKSFITENPVWFILILVLVAWDVVWRVIGIVHAVRLSETGWIIALSIFSTIGILPIIYLRNRSIL